MDAAFYEPYTDLRTLVDPTCTVCGRDLSRRTPSDLLMWYPEGGLGPVLLIGLICEACSETAGASSEKDGAEGIDGAKILDTSRVSRACRKRHLRVVE